MFYHNLEIPRKCSPRTPITLAINNYNDNGGAIKPGLASYPIHQRSSRSSLGDCPARCSPMRVHTAAPLIYWLLHSSVGQFNIGHGSPPAGRALLSLRRATADPLFARAHIRVLLLPLPTMSCSMMLIAGERAAGIHNCRVASFCSPHGSFTRQGRRACI